MTRNLLRFLSLLLVTGLLSTVSKAQTLTEAFDGNYKSSYDVSPPGNDANDNITLPSGSWRLYGALTGNLSSDRYNGTYGVRMRGGGSQLYMNFDKANGAGDFSFYYARYGSDAGLSIQASYSTDGGNSWTNAGSAISTTGITTLTLATIPINQPGNIRIRLSIPSGSASVRCDIDDISVTDFGGACTTPSAPAGVSFSNITAAGFTGTIDNGANPAPSGFLVVRYTGSTAPSAPTDGTVYSAANIATLDPGGVTGLEFVQSDTATNFTEASLAPGVTYNYNIYAYNNTACSGGPKYATVLSGSQATSSSAPACTAPASQATTLAFSGITTSSVSGAVSGVTADGFLVVRGSGSAPSQPVDGTVYSAANIASLGTGLTFVSDGVASFTENSLGSNTSYTYYVFAYNNAGCIGGPVYNTATALSASQYTLPDTATAIGYTNLTSASFDAQWSAPATGAAGYYLDVAYNSSFSSLVTGYNNLDVNNVTTYTVSGLSSGTTYYFRVRAYNAGGTGDNSALSPAIPVPCAAPTAVATGLNFTDIANTTFKINWTNSGNGLKRVVKINTVNSFSVTDGVDPNANNAYTSGEQTVYNGTGTSVTVNGLSQNTTYYVAVYEAGCTGANILYNMSPLTGSQITTNLQTTMLNPGDVAVVGYDGNGTSCGGSSRDQIWIVCFKDIVTGTTFDITDNGWERLNANEFGNTEGIYRYTYTGAATIPAGTVLKVMIDNASNVQSAMTGLYGSGSWTVNTLGGSSNSVALNNTGDQFLIMQDGTWNNGTSSGHDATYTGGRILYGFSSTSPGWVSFTGSDLGTQASVLPAATTCLNAAPQLSGGTAWLTYNGPVTAADRPTWLYRFANAANWTTQSSCTNTNNAIVTVFGGTTGTDYGTISITTGNVAMNWTGAVSTDWSDCRNWDLLTVPDTATDVTIPAAASNQPSTGTSISAHDLSIESGAALTMGNGNVAGIKGDFTNNGTFDASQASVSLDGLYTQTATGLNAANVTLNNAGGLILASDAAVTNTLTMTAGSINTGAYTLTLGASAAQPGTLAYTSGLVTGKMKRWFAAATNSGNASSLFPIGVSGSDRSVQVAYTAAPSSGGTLTAQFINTAMGNNISVSGNIVSACTGGTGFAVTKTSDSYWQIDAADGLTGGNYDITLAAQGMSGTSNTCQLTLLKRDQPGAWQEDGTHVEPYTAGGILYLQRTGASGWSDWGIAGSSASPLAIELSTFNAAKMQNTVALTWSTAAEHTGDRFELERSGNGRDYTTITTVTAIGFAADYNYTDSKPLQGNNYYRLLMKGADGGSKYSAVRIVSMGSDRSFAIVAFPNPVSDRLTVQAINKNTAGTLQVTDLAGRVLLQLVMNEDAADVDMSGFAPGVYLVHYADGVHSELFKIVK